MKILFVTPFAGLTGSEMMLRYLVNSLKGSGYEAIVGANKPGQLLKEFNCDTFSIPFPDGLPVTIPQRIYNKWLIKTTGVTIGETWWKNQLHKINPDVVYFNTIHIHNWDFFLQNPDRPFVVHVHEMAFAYAHIIGYERMKNMMEKATLLIACSAVVKDMLEQMGLTKIALIHEALDPERIKVSEGSRIKIRKQLGIPEDDFVWIMAGTADFRKGLDFVAPIMARLPKRGVHLLWMGAKSERTGLDYYARKQMEFYGLTNIHFPGQIKEEYYDYFSAGDGFILPSREDPFPLVMIEAAYLGLPIVGFNSGGISEFVQEGMGKVIEGFEVEKLAATMYQIMDGTFKSNPEKARKRAEEFLIAGQSEKWLKALNKHLKK